MLRLATPQDRAAPGTAGPARDAYARGGRLVFYVAVAQSVLFGLSSLFNGFYEFAVWGPLTLALLAVVTFVVLVGPLRLSRPGQVALGALGVLLLWAALSANWSESLDRTWTEVNRLLFYFVVLLITVAGVRAVREARIVLGVLTTAFVAVSGYVMVRCLIGEGPDLFIAYRLAEPMGYVNGQASFFLMAFWAFIAVAEFAGKPLWRGAGLGMATVAAELMVLTQSRAVIPALVISAAFLLAVVPGRVVRAWALLVASVGAVASTPWLLDVYSERTGDISGVPDAGVVQQAAAVGLVFAVISAAIWTLGCIYLPRLEPARLRRAAIVPLIAIPLIGLAGLAVKTGNPWNSVQDEYDTFVQLGPAKPDTERFTSLSGTRYDLWRVAADQFGDAPLGGVGAGNFTKTYFLERETLENVRQPHSWVMQILAELGLVGLLAFLAFVGGVGWAILSRRNGGVAREDPFLMVACSGIFLVWLTQTSVDWLHNLPGVTGVALIAAGALVALPEARGRDRDWFDRLPRARGIALLAAVCLIGAGAISVGRQYAADRYRQSGEEQLGEDPAEALSDANSALSLNAENLPSYYLKAAAFARLNRYDDAVRTLREAADREPHSYVPWVLLGDLALRVGAYDDAASYYGRASLLNPRESDLLAIARDPRSALQ